MPMGMSSRDWYQYRQCTANYDTNEFEIVYQDIEDMTIPDTDGMVR